MNILIPFEKTIKFSSPICEITKISLEHDYTVNDESILGNFYVSGEYRCNEISVNTLEFKETLPFNVEINNTVKKDTVDVEISDFTYEIIDKESIKVCIEYKVSAEIEEPVEMERVDVDFEEELEHLNDLELDVTEDKEEVETKEEDRKIDENIKNDIINNISSNEDEYITYHVHIIKENESIESICTTYNITKMDLSSLNNLEDISIGDKLIIPNESN